MLCREALAETLESCGAFGPLRVEIAYTAKGERAYMLCAPLVYHVHLNGGSLRIRVPEGFVTNFASTPRFSWPLYPPDGPWAAASVLHDYLYVHGRCSRFLADALFRDAMAELGVPWHRRWCMYAAVRLFGWRAWADYRRGQ